MVVHPGGGVPGPDRRARARAQPERPRGAGEAVLRARHRAHRRPVERGRRRRRAIPRRSSLRPRSRSVRARLAVPAAQHRPHRGRRSDAGRLAEGAGIDRRGRARQAAVAELRERIDFREEVAVIAAEARVSRTGSLAAWTAAEPVGFTAAHALLFACIAPGHRRAVAGGASPAGFLPRSAVFGWCSCRPASRGTGAARCTRC